VPSDESAASVEPGPGVLAFYRTLAAELTRGVTRQGILETGLLLSYLALRSFDAARTALIGWTAALVGLGWIWPASGLLVLVAVAPFTEWMVLDRTVGTKIVVLVLLAAGLAARLLLERRGYVLSGLRREPVLITAGLLEGALLLSLAVTAWNFESDFTTRAAATWLGGLGGGVLAFGVGVWAARHQPRPILTVALAAIILAAAVSLVDFAAPGNIRLGPLDWLLRPQRIDFGRLSGVIPAPNAAAALFLIGFAIALSRAVFGDGRRRWLWLLPVAFLALTTFLTYSRSGLIGIGLIVVLMVARVDRKKGLLLLAIVAVIVLVAAPAYISMRASNLGLESHGDWLTLISGDVKRLDGWIGAWRMWLSSPIIGSGFQSFFEWHERFGVTTVSAPHNEFLRLLAEGGVLAAGAFAAFVLTIGRALWTSRGGEQLGALGALIGVIAAGMFNNPFGYVQLMAVLFATLGVAYGAIPRVSGNGHVELAGPGEEG
jgi:O-Antigen ligase